jgi:threonine dehydratase
MNACPDLETIRTAARRIAPYVLRTPVLTCKGLDGLFGAKCYFKCENFQKVGAFKFRGACNAVFLLSDSEAQRGVITHSSGNHAAALALAARKRGVEAQIVMPHNASAVKKAAVAGYGGKIIPSISPHTIADGLLTSLGDLTFPIIKKHVHKIVPVGEEAIVAGMRYVWERMKIIIEPSSAVPIGVLLEKKVNLANRRIGIILTGGNVDLDKLPWVHAKK